jgi:hypothetical protein
MLNNMLNGWGAPMDTPNLQELQKALTTGYAYGVTDQTNGAALRVESLESTLRSLTYDEQHVKLWKHIPKMQAFNTVEEYNVLNSYGSLANPFIPEGVMPETDDSNYARKVSLVKYLGTTRVVTHQATLVRGAHGDVIALENANGIKWLMKQVEQALFFGNNTLAFNYSNVSGGNEGIEFAGIDCQVDPTMVVDAQGAPLSEGLLQDACETIAANYGRATHIYTPYKVASDFSKTYYNKERVVMPSPEGMRAGTNITTFASQFGDIDIVPDVFLTKNRKAYNNGGLQGPTTATSATAPQVPASVTSALTASSTNGVWKALNAVIYKVSAVNRFGESAASAASTGLTVTANTKTVTLTITNPSSISGLTPDYFNIYRSDNNGATFFYIDSVATLSQSASGVTTYIDTGLYMTNVSTCYLGELDPQVLAFKQLAPMMKMDLAVLGPAIRWMILLYGTCVLYQPKKWAKIINVGDLSN